MRSIDEMLAPADEAPESTRTFVFDKLVGEPRFYVLPFSDENGDWLDRALTYTMASAKPSDAPEPEPADDKTYRQQCHDSVDELVDTMIAGWAVKDDSGEYVEIPAADARPGAKELLHKLIDKRQGLAMFIKLKAFIYGTPKTAEPPINPEITAGNSAGG